jgi:hypothetical protein
MGQFKPMVKMMTTEPSVELKLKKGGHVQRKAMGGMPDAMGMPAAAKPSERGIPMAARRGIAPKMTVPKGGMRGPMMRKKGGEVESKSMHKAEMAEMKGIKKELKSHEDKPASKALNRVVLQPMQPAALFRSTLPVALSRRSRRADFRMTARQ